ncbi:MAG TPA: hypothetical protein DDY14_11195 [Chromatiaceae bacterium]|jgi:hypothetical protein|nr:MAG: hypothetical protein N838_01905 [Thiohalocapsa sp. PB-PSB1]HBG95856.1 hypothetical protein [Chromatiaceae bacterium]
MMNNTALITTAFSLTLIGATLIGTDSIARGPGGYGGCQQGRGGPPRTERMTLLERLDTDGDGVMNMQEFIDGHTDKAERHFDRKDRDDNGLLSLEEFTTSGRRYGRGPDMDELDQQVLQACMEEILGYELPVRPNSEAAFASTDSDLNASVDLDEFQTAGLLRAEKRFAQIDTDSNGLLTNAELQAFRAERQQHRNAHHRCVIEQLNMEDLLNQPA